MATPFSIPVIPSEGPTVAVIGCGPAGMFFLRQIELYRSQLEEKLLLEESERTDIEAKLRSLPRPTVFEKDSKCGGLWQSKSMKPGEEHVQSEGMYDGMWINAPKEIFEFADYTFDEHFKKPMPSFITRHQVLGYIEGCTKDAMDKYTNAGSIIFDKEVRWIDFNETTNLFSVDAVPSGTQEFFASEKEEEESYDETLYFDKVVVATGSEYKPIIPQREKNLLAGNNKTTAVFDRPVVHSSQIKSLGGDIAGKNFLFIGSSYSAEDLALSFIKRGANHIYVTSRSFNAYPMDVTNSWPMDKLTLLLRSEIKEVLEDNKLRMGRMNLKAEFDQYIAKTYYNQTHNNFILDGIDAVIFCTGYESNEDLTSPKLYAHHSENPLVKSNMDPSHWPNIYDPAVFDPENGRPLPSETPLNSCANPIHSNSTMLRADPNDDLYNQREGFFNHHIISNPGFFRAETLYETPLLNLDIQTTFILKVMTGDIPTPDTQEEMHHQRSRNMAEWLRHSSETRYFRETDFREALIRHSYETYDPENYEWPDWYRPYTTGFAFFKLFMEARRAGHPAGSFVVEIDPEDDGYGGDDYKDACWEFGYMRFEGVDGPDGSNGTWGFSDRGIKFMEQATLHSINRMYVKDGTNETFRDMHHEEYQSVWTGTKPVPFTKLWMDVDDILGDVPIAETIASQENISTTLEIDCVGDVTCDSSGATGDVESLAEL